MADRGAPKQNEPFFYHNLTSSRARERDFGRARGGSSRAVRRYAADGVCNRLNSTKDSIFCGQQVARKRE